MELKRVVLSDRELVAQMTKDTWPWGDYIAEVFDSWLNEGIFLKAVDGDELLGIVHLRVFNDYAWIEGVRVRKDLRGRGIGKAMVSQAMSMAGARRFGALIRDNNHASLALFHGLGFRDLLSVFYHHGARNRVLGGERLDERSEPGFLDDWVWFPSSYDHEVYLASVGGSSFKYVKASPPFVVEGVPPKELDIEYTSLKSSGEADAEEEGFFVVTM